MELCEVRAAAQELEPNLLAWRRHLHRRPELSFQEHETAAYIAAELAAMPGLTVTRPTATSVVGTIEGHGPGPTVALRADIDGLPVREETGLPFASERDGVMHACGHDGHTAMLLGAAALLAAERGRFPGAVRLIFQHAEESLPGGAQELVARGVMDGVDAVLGQHLWLPLDAGRLGLAPGPITAAVDTFEAVVVGRGGHAAQPHLTVDAVVLAAQVVLGWQTIVSRERDPLLPLVLSVTRIEGGRADNVLPDEVRLIGTVRSTDPALRQRVAERMEEILAALTAAAGGSYRLEITRGYAPVVNDAALSARLLPILAEVLGPGIVEPATPSMVGEDFSAYGAVAPSCFWFLGARSPSKGITYPHHHARFTVDEDVLPLGVAALVGAALGLLHAPREA